MNALKQGAFYLLEKSRVAISGKGFVMKKILTGVSLLAMCSVVYSAPVVYTSKSAYLAELASLGLSTVTESFENNTVWAASRNSIVAPGKTPSVTSKGIVWTSNHAQNKLATGDVGGGAPGGTYAIYSLPHGLTNDSGLYCDSAEDPDIPIECYQNDGLKIESASGEQLYAFGGRVDSNTGSPKMTFLLDGVDINGNDTDNIDNWQREGDSADNWAFVGVIDTDGFLSAELRELKGKDYQQVLLFADSFVIGVSLNDADGDGVLDDDDFYPNISLGGRLDTDGDGRPNDCDAACELTGMMADDDDDGDGHIDTADNCPLIANPDQLDDNNDGIGNLCQPPGCA
jgi:hypothetical protein